MQNVSAHNPRRSLVLLRVPRSTAVLCLCAALALNACSGSSSSDSTVPPVETQTPEPDASVPEGLLLLQDDPGLQAEIPEVLLTVTTAGVGMQVAYTRVGQVDDVPAELIETQWLYMQECLGQSGVAPIVVVRDGPVTPFTLLDDVIRDIEGTPVASGSLRAVPILQIQEDDFDPALSNPGFNLRSIMGRMLWLSASLPERDYPYECARQASP